MRRRVKADADDERRDHAKSGPLRPVDVVVLLDDLGHGQLVCRLAVAAKRSITGNHQLTLSERDSA